MFVALRELLGITTLISEKVKVLMRIKEDKIQDLIIQLKQLQLQQTKLITCLGEVSREQGNEKK